MGGRIKTMIIIINFQDWSRQDYDIPSTKASKGSRVKTRQSKEIPSKQTQKGLLASKTAKKRHSKKETKATLNKKTHTRSGQKIFGIHSDKRQTLRALWKEQQSYKWPPYKKRKKVRKVGRSKL